MVTRRQVEDVARLARLRLDEDEAERLTRELNGILEHVEALGEVDLAGVEAVDGEIDHAAAARADVPATDALQALPATFAPAFDEGFFTVPKLAAMADPEAG